MFHRPVLSKSDEELKDLRTSSGRIRAILHELHFQSFIALAGKPGAE